MRPAEKDKLALTAPPTVRTVLREAKPLSYCENYVFMGLCRAFSHIEIIISQHVHIGGWTATLTSNPISTPLPPAASVCCWVLKTTKASQPGFINVGRPAVSLQYFSSQTFWFESIILQYPLRSEASHCLAKWKKESGTKRWRKFSKLLSTNVFMYIFFSSTLYLKTLRYFAVHSSFWHTHTHGSLQARQF